MDVVAKASNLGDYYETFHAARNKTGTVAVHERLAFIVEQTGKGKRVVELGCRFGSLLELVKEGNEIHGTDIDRNAMRVCEERLGIRPIPANLNETLPFEDSHFDVVILSEVLEHLPYPAITLSEVARILRPSGRIVGSVPNGTRLRNRLRFMLEGRVEMDPTHLQHYGVETLTAELQTFFSSIQVRPISSRFLRISPRHFANYLLFTAVKPTHG
ncbi:MAG: class I SAM-dependent methyltransferase [Acidobacteriota bacterium]